MKIEDLIREQTYNGIDWKRREQLAKDLDIQEPVNYATTIKFSTYVQFDLARH